MSDGAARNGMPSAQERDASLTPNDLLRRPPANVATATSYKQWNTNKLHLRIASDALSAASAAGLIAPLITIFDRYVNQHNVW